MSEVASRSCVKNKGGFNLVKAENAMFKSSKGMWYWAELRQSSPAGCCGHAEFTALKERVREFTKRNPLRVTDTKTPILAQDAYAEQALVIQVQ